MLIKSELIVHNESKLFELSHLFFCLAVDASVQCVFDVLMTSLCSSDHQDRFGLRCLTEGHVDSRGLNPRAVSLVLLSSLSL